MASAYADAEPLDPVIDDDWEDIESDGTADDENLDEQVTTCITPEDRNSPAPPPLAITCGSRRTMKDEKRLRATTEANVADLRWPTYE